MATTAAEERLTCRARGRETTLPAPWRVESWATATMVNDRRVGGPTVYRAVSADNVPITDPTEYAAFHETVVASRNEGTVIEDVEAAREMARRGVADAFSEVDRVRAAWHKERDELMRSLRHYQLDNLKLREKHGELRPGDAVLLRAFREDGESETPLFEGAAHA